MNTILTKLRALFRRKNLEAEMAEEMRQHLERRTQEKIAAGIAPDEARYAAQREFGGIAQAQERCRDERGFIWLEQTLLDLRQAVRGLTKDRSFTITAVLTLAFGIGVNAALFTVFNAVSLRPLPVRAPDELVMLRGGNGTLHGGSDPTFSYTEYLIYRENNRVFSDVAAHFSGARAMEVGAVSGAPRDQTAIEKPAVVLAQFVSENYFAVLGGDLILGRTFSAEEELVSDAHPVIVVSHRFWEQRLARDPNIVGQSVMLDGRQHTVVGVTSPEFMGHHPAPPAGWLPLGSETRRGESRGRWPLFLTGRLKPGVSLAAAGSNLDAIAQQLARDFPRQGRKTSIELQPGMRWLHIPINLLTLAVFSPVLLGFGMVLLIACTNVTNLLFARGVTRYQEIGVRLTLGASRGRIIRQLLTENLLLCALGGVAGLVMALWAIQIFRPIVLSYLPREWAPLTEMWNFLSFAPDYRVLGCTVVLVVLAAVAAGLAPAWHASRGNLLSALKDEGSAFGRKLTHSRLRNFLVVSQVAVCLVLLSCTGLLVRNLLKVRGADVGFDYKRIYDVSLELGPLRGDPRNARLLEAVETLRSLPGVASTTAVQGAPLLGAQQAAVKAGAGNAGEERGATVLSPYAIVTAGFFDTFGIALHQGRAFTAPEVDTRANVAVISESLARRLWPAESALGKTLSVSEPDARLAGSRSPAQRAGGAYEIVGIVHDVQSRLMEPDRAFVYLPVRDGIGFNGLYLRPRDGSDATLAAITRAAEFAGVKVAIRRQLGKRLEEDLLPFLGAAWLSGLLGGLALLMAAVGIYGVMSFSVRRRGREIGIRVALGATAQKVVALFVQQGMRLVAIGAVIGLGGTMIALLALTKFWYGVGAAGAGNRIRDIALDPAAYVVVTLILAGVALLACWLPARRAAKIDPMIALRSE